MKNIVKTINGERIEATTPVETAKEYGFNSPNTKQREKDLQASVERAVTLLRLHAKFDPSAGNIQSMTVGELSMLQDILEHGNTVGLWLTPTKWAGGMNAGMRIIDLRKRIVDYLEEPHRAMVREAEDAVARPRLTGGGESVQFHSAAASCLRAFIDGAVVVATRYLLLCRIGPAGMRGGRGRSLDTTTLADIGTQYLPALLSVAVGKWLDDIHTNSHISATSSLMTRGYLSTLEQSDLERFSESTRERMMLEVKRARMLADMGLWVEAPLWEIPVEQVTAVKGEARGRKAQPKAVNKHLPLPDDYVAEMGSKSLWIIQELGPNLITILERIRDIWRSNAESPLSGQMVGKERLIQLREYLEEYAWRDSNGVEFVRPPFEVQLSRRGMSRLAQGAGLDSEAAVEFDLDDEGMSQDNDTKSGSDAEPLERLQWPPRQFAHIVGLVAALQSAHLFVVAMSVAPRKTELLSFERNCVVRARDSTTFARGRTFKLVERHEGELRDWVLPDVAAEAIEQQVSLVNLMEAIGPQWPHRTEDNKPVSWSQTGTHLWFQTYERTRPLTSVTSALRSYARMLGMCVTPDGQSIRTHRFRKTVARLAGLALTDAPTILMQVFGHKSIEMTLYYILTDPDLQVDVEQVRRELKIMRGVAVVESMVPAAVAEAAQEAQGAIDKARGDNTASVPGIPLFGVPHAGYGGPAAPKLFGAVKERVISVHRTGREWGAGDSYETAYFLTEAGLTFTMPRNGVFCTKAFTQSAACTGKRGKTDPGNCQSSCVHRLELAARRAQLEASLAKQVELYQEALKEGHELLQSGLGKKICDALKPFEDIREKWMKHPIIRQLVEAAGEAVT